jgi:uncharacterized protein YhaN
MKFTDLNVDCFGVWSGLGVSELSPGLNVFYGRNEAGKTTLMQFARAVLYGFSPERRARYLPPVRGGRGGGSLSLLTPRGRFRISRIERDHLPVGETTIVAADGTIQGEPQLRELLGGIDETIFNNVFAVGLGEMQELGTLDGTAAARLLYDLSTGLDRVSLAEVLHELEASRNRLLSPDDGPSQISELLAKRDAFRADLEELSNLTARHWQVAADRERLAEQIARAEAELAGIERESRIVELAAAIEPKWHARAALDEQLAALGPPSHLPANALLKMDRYRERIRGCRRRVKKISLRRKKHAAELSALKINEPLWKQAPRILALAEHELWIAAAEQQLREAEAEVAKLEQSNGPAIKPAAGKPAQPTTASPAKNGVSESLSTPISPVAIAALRGPAADLRRKSRAARAAKQSIGQLQEQAANHTDAVEKSLLEAGETDLPAALEKAGDLTSKLRRRVQLVERLDRMSRHRADLEEQSHELLERQILPGWILASLGGIFMLGVLLLLAGLFLPTKIIGSFGGTLAVLGILAFGTAAAAKWLFEKAAARQLETCRKQLTMLEAQKKQAQLERDSLDEQLPKGGGSLTSRLQAAEANLAKLEALMPLDAKCATAGQDKETAKRQAAAARDELKAAHRRWQSAVVAAGLPKSTSPKQIGQLVRENAAAHDAHRKLRDARDERVRRKRELAAFSARIEPLAIDAEVLPESASLSEQLRQLKKQVAEQESLVARRDAMRKRLRRLRASKTKYRRMLRRYQRRRMALLHSAGVSDEAEFARRAAERGHVDQLHHRREAVVRELKEVMIGVCTETDLAGLVGPAARDVLPGRRMQVAERLNSARATLHELFEQRGQFSEQLRALSDDRGITRKRLELGVVEERLKEAIKRWQVLAMTRMILDSIKQDYERNRQPETLREASGYLARMTEGRYKRVWTPLGEETLRVDDSAGQSLLIEVLSRGTREQLFLSLRLALVGLYSRRGQSMPLVLDDVLVNFDEDRARAAAAVLQDFAAAGHQLFVFTCHEHLAATFKSLGVGVRRLPNNVESGGGVPPLKKSIELAIPPKPVVVEQPKRRRSKPKPEPQPVAELQADDDAAFELAPLDDLPLPPPIAAEILQPELIRAEPIVPAREHRADPPHKRVILRSFRRRWSAEEFEGELEDRVASAFALDDRLADDDLNGDTSDI